MCTIHLRHFSWLVLLAGGCGGSPFTALQFGNHLTNAAAGGAASSASGGATVHSTCDLPRERKIITRMGLANFANGAVQYSLTFVASAGPGGFVCDDDLPDYQRAGYRSIPLDSTTETATVGCDPVPLTRGTQLLMVTVTGTIAGTNDPQNPTTASAPFGGETPFPLPELIVLGDSSGFTCQGSATCTQGGFRYIDIAGKPIATATASRTQDTVCNSGAGSLPEWRLLDPSQPDKNAGTFHYTSGCFIGWSILDRANDANVQANQVIWGVADVRGNPIHTERP